MRVWSVLLGLVLLTAGSVAWGQNSADDPPEILSAEMALRTVLESDQLDATFVIVDTDNVVEVTINGEAQTITPADTVQISRKLVFTQDVTRVTVTATDVAGHKRTVVYTVFRPGVDPNVVAAAEAPAAAKLRWFGTYDVRLESDSNPSNDLSLPFGISIADVPALGTNAPADTRTNLLLTGGVIKGQWTGYGGLWRIGYGDADYKDRYDVMALFLGGSGTFPLKGDYSFQISYTLSDLNIGGDNYSQSHLIAPAFLVQGDDGAGGTVRTTWALDLAIKSFASDTQSNATDYRFRWDSNRTRANKLDRRRRVIALGKSSEGIPDTEYSFLSVDYDWTNRWESGMLWDIGWGFAYRDYPNDTGLISETRLDLPLRFSTGIGFQVRRELRIMGTMNYLQNLSTAGPFTRTIVGIGVNGTF